MGLLVYTLPATFLILLLREVFRNFLFNRIFNIKTNHPLYYIDPIALVTTAFFGFSWSGAINYERKDNIITFLASQIFFIIFMLLSIVYFYSQHPIESLYWLNFLQALVKTSWCMAIVNFIPVLPFDGSFFYAVKLQQSPLATPIFFVAKLIAILCISMGFVDMQMLGADKVLDLFNMK